MKFPGPSEDQQEDPVEHSRDQEHHQDKFRDRHLRHDRPLEGDQDQQGGRDHGQIFDGIQEVGSRLFPEADPVDDDGLGDIGDDAGNHGADVDARHSQPGHQRQGEDQVHQPLDQRQVFILLEYPGRGLEVGQHHPFPLEEVIDEVPADDGRGQHPLRPHVQLHQRRQQQEKSHRGKAVHPDGEEAVYRKELELPVLPLRGDQVSEAGDDGIENHVDVVGDRIDDELVGAHEPHPHHAQKGRDDDGVRLQPGHVTDAVQHQRLRVVHHALPLFLFQRLNILLLKQRVFFVQIAADENLLGQLHPRLDQQIQKEVGQKEQACHLHGHGNHLGDGDGVGLDIVFLLRVCQAVFPGDEVRAHRIKQVDQIVQPQFFHGEVAGIPHDHRQEGDEDQPCGRDDQGDDPVGLFVQQHIGFDLFLFPSGGRPVQAVVHRSADAQLRQGKHGQDIRIKPLHAGEGIPQLHDEHVPQGEAKQHGHHVAGQSEDDVFRRVSYSSHSISPSVIAKNSSTVPVPQG